MRGHLPGRLVGLVVVVLVAAVACGGSSPPTSAKTVSGKKVAWVLWGTDAYAQAKSAAFKKAAEAEGLTVTIIDGKNDPVVQSKAIDTLIAQHIDGIVWQPSDAASGLAAATKIRNAHIPLVFSETETDPSALKAPFVPGNNISDLVKQAGVDAGTFVTQTLHQTPKAVIFDITNVPVCHENRMVPFMDGVKSVSADTKAVFWDTVPVTKDGNITKMQNVLQATPDFNIFTGCGGDLILGGYAGLQNAGRGKAVNGVPKTEWVLMIDGTPEQMNLQIDPNSSVEETIMQTPYENGNQAWNYLKQMMLGTMPLDSNETANIPGVVFKKSDSCSQINTQFSKEFGTVYQPLTCPS
jgi:ABC-type sugar transport system substrate-binding protein